MRISSPARCHSLRPKARYADACHLCYETRVSLRPTLPDILGPDQMYGRGAGQAQDERTAAS